MKKVKLLVLMLLVSGLATACGGSSSSSDNPGKYAMSKLPSKYSANIPNSITPSKSSKAPRLSKVISRAAGGESQGCKLMKGMIEMMQGTAKMAPVYAVIADAAISQNNLSADETKHTCSVTLTQEMFNTISEIMGEDMGDVSDMEEEVGQTTNIDVVYSDNGSAPYTNSVAITAFEQTSTIYWSDDKTKTKLSMAMESESESSEGDESSSSGTLDLIYDGAANEMQIVLSSQDGSSMNMSLKEKNGGALFYSRDKYVGSVYLMEGYADDNGGYIKMTATNASGSIISASETFNASGSITSESSDYNSAFSSGSSDMAGLQQDTGLTMAVSVADGMYLISTDAVTFTVGSTATIVGFGTVKSGTLVIQDIGGGKAGLLADAKKDEVFLYPVSFNSSNVLKLDNTVPQANIQL